MARRFPLLVLAALCACGPEATDLSVPSASAVLFSGFGPSSTLTVTATVQSRHALPSSLAVELFRGTRMIRTLHDPGTGAPLGGIDERPTEKEFRASAGIEEVFDATDSASLGQSLSLTLEVRARANGVSAIKSFTVVLDCATPETAICAGKCVSPRSDARNCGTCGNVCGVQDGGTGTCASWVCR